MEDKYCFMNDIKRENVKEFRKMFVKLGVVVAEVDLQLRYVWIDNPHPDFNPHEVVGKRDDELISKEEAKGIMTLKRKVITSEKASSQVFDFNRSDGKNYYNIAAYPIYKVQGKH